MNTQVDVRSNGLDKDCGDLFFPFVSQPHVVYFSGIPVQGIKDNSVTAIELSDTTQNGKLESCGAVVLSHLLAANTSVTSVRNLAALAAYFAAEFENSELCVPNFQWLCPSCFPETTGRGKIQLSESQGYDRHRGGPESELHGDQNRRF